MIELHSRCYYPIYDGFKSGDYPPQKFIKALKGQAVNGYAHIPLIDGRRLKLNAQNAHLAVQVFGQWGAEKLDLIGVASPSLVPIPSSTHTDPCDDFTAKSMCEAINEYADGPYEILPCLYQATAVQGSSKGGSRKFVDIRDNLRMNGNVAGKTVILVDDVKTSGNHLRACATILREQGATVDYALCAGRTVWERPDDMWSVPLENVDWDNGEFD